MNLTTKYHLAQELAVMEAELAKRESYKIGGYFRDTGPLRRELYTAAMQFFDAGSRYPERLLLGGNRTGKTENAAYEVTCHLTGIYPHWWTGRRFDHPVEIWTAGDTATTTRDIQQLTLYGPVPAAPRTGMIPAHLITHVSPRSSIPNGIETIWVRHVSGGDSSIHFKSYDQRREAFQGTSRHVIWLDEECPEEIYTECLLRTLTCDGIVIVTFTPVEGLTPFVQTWLENSVMLDMMGDLQSADSQIFSGGDDDIDSGQVIDVEARRVDEVERLKRRQKFTTMISWDDVPHLSPAAREQMLVSIPPYQRAARTRGIPALGSGVIYPIPDDEIRVKPFEVPIHWPRGYGMDVGWNWTVAVFGAYDRDTSTLYLYHEHWRSHAEPSVHAAGIRAAGEWIPGRIDPGANGRSQSDGVQLIQSYRDLGLSVENAPNGVEAGIFDVWTMLTAGRLRVFGSLKHWFNEYRMYRRDAKGRVVKKNDHLMDATRYLVASKTDWMLTEPVPPANSSAGMYTGPNSWM